MEIFKDIWNWLVDVCSSPGFAVAGGLSLTFGFLGIVYLLLCAVFGVTPIAFRLGFAIWQRRVAIIGSGEAYSSLRSTLVDSGVFREKRISHIGLDKIEKVRGETVLLVDWTTAQAHVDQILSNRKSINTAVVIFAKPESIPRDKLGQIVDHPNTVVVNSRGRLLNDILTSLMTTSYDRG